MVLAITALAQGSSSNKKPLVGSTLPNASVVLAKAIDREARKDTELKDLVIKTATRTISQLELRTLLKVVEKMRKELSADRKTVPASVALDVVKTAEPVASSSQAGSLLGAPSGISMKGSGTGGVPTLVEATPKDPVTVPHAVPDESCASVATTTNKVDKGNDDSPPYGTRCASGSGSGNAIGMQDQNRDSEDDRNGGDNRAHLGLDMEGSNDIDGEIQGGSKKSIDGGQDATSGANAIALARAPMIAIGGPPPDNTANTANSEMPVFHNSGVLAGTTECSAPTTCADKALAGFGASANVAEDMVTTPLNTSGSSDRTLLDTHGVSSGIGRECSATIPQPEPPIAPGALDPEQGPGAPSDGCKPVRVTSGPWQKPYKVTQGGNTPGRCRIPSDGTPLGNNIALELRERPVTQAVIGSDRMKGWESAEGRAAPLRIASMPPLATSTIFPT
jgi:hypothetical protein